MKFFLDTEFIEYPCTIDLISVAIVDETGREFYAESVEFDESKASPWVKKNVIAKLWSRSPKWKGVARWTEFLQQNQANVGGLMGRITIRDEILKFVGDEQPEFWGYYCDYDWVAFCWLFGTMMDLPKGWPMYCRDLKQLADSMKDQRLPKQEEGKHVALHDARWNRTAYDFLNF